MLKRCEQVERAARRAFELAVLCAVVAILGGCATGGVTSNIFVDPSRYELYDCKQLATERVAYNAKVVQLEGLMAKAETGVAGGLVSGLAYQADYSEARARRDLIDQKLAANNCAAEPPVVVAPEPLKSKKRKPR